MIRISSELFARSYARNPFRWLLGLVATILPSAFIASKLNIESDFKHLLPQSKPSVVALDRLMDRVGGISTFIVAVESDDISASKRFIDDLVPRLKELPEHFVRYVEHNITDLRTFYTDNKYLYINLEDLEEIHERLARKIRYEKLRNNPFFIALDEDTVDFDVSDIEEKYKSRTDRYDDYIDGYFFSEDSKLAAVVIRPYGASTGTGFARDLGERVRAVVEDLDPSSYHPSLRVGYVGKFVDVLNEYSQLIRDILETLSICLLLVALALYLYFMRLRVVPLLAAALGSGVIWAFALTKWHIGYLNSQTAFLGSIIVGNGVNHGIILLSRYLECRRLGDGIEEALVTAIRTTWLATLAAAVTTSAAFAALSFSEIKGFSHFGFIGGVGMTLCWLGSFTVLPCLLVLTERVAPVVGPQSRRVGHWNAAFFRVGGLVTGAPRVLAGLGLLASAAGITAAVRFLPVSLEYDFTKLRNKPRDSAAADGNLKSRVQDIFGQSLSPVVILLDDEAQALSVCDAVMAADGALPETRRTVDSCKTLHSYLPEMQDEKLTVLSRIRSLAHDNALNFVDKKYREEIDDFRRSVDLKKLDLEGLPESIRRNFMELDGTLGRFAYVYSRPDANLNNGKRLTEFVDTLSAITLTDGSVVRMSGEPAIFSDLLRAVARDGPLATLYSFIGVALLIAITFRRRRPFVYVLSGLCAGIACMLGIQALLQIKLNFFNFIALPVTFGIGVDYSVNLLQRYYFEGPGSVRKVIGASGAAIALCSTTTIIGYSSLLFAQSQALVSFGWLALIGEIACVSMGLLVMPAVLHLADRRRPPAIHLTEVRKAERAS